MKNHISDGFGQTSGTVENVQRIAFLRTDGDGIQYGGNRIFSFQTPLVIVEMKNMSFLNSAMNQPYFCRITHVGAQNRRRRVSINPGTHGNIFSAVCVFIGQRRTVAHGFGTITDSCSGRWQTSVRVCRRIPVFVPNFQLIVEEYGIFPESWFIGRVNICEKAAFQFGARLRIQPSGLG